MASDELINQTLGRQYQIKSVLGRGGMATVYLARQASMDRDVAIKVMARELADDEQFVARFEHEAQVIARLQHPHILPVIDFGKEGKLVFIVMRLVRGGSLDDRLRDGALPLNLASRMMAQIASALTFAHELGIIHRDLKPNNVLLDERDNAYLTDFGIAKMLAGTTKLTATGNILGTPSYMAPEQWRGEPVDARTDTYSLGVMLYEMVLGRLPFAGDTPYTLMYKHFNDAPPPPRQINPTLPPAIEAVILRALAKEADARYQSADDLAIDFDNAVRGLPIEVQQRPSGDLDKTIIGEESTPVPRAQPTPPGMEEAATLRPQTPGPMQPPIPGAIPAPGTPVTADAAARKRPLNPVMLGVVAVIVLAVIAGGAYFLFGGGDGGGKETPVVQAPSETPTEAPTFTPEPTERSTFATVVTDRADVRRWPGAEFEEVGALAANDEVQVLGVSEDGRWYQVWYNGQPGWIAASSVRTSGNPDIALVTWDRDGDRLPDEDDACPDDAAHDDVGDPCNHDEDGDEIPDGEDVCPTDAAHDDVGDPCNHDEDADDVPDGEDACPLVAGAVESAGCPPDGDGDGVPDADDACPEIAGLASLAGCLPDADGDGVPNVDDRCPFSATEDEVGNPCNPDEDGDDVPDAEDACPFEPGGANGCPDADGDGVLDAEDACPNEAGTIGGCPDGDEDGIADRDDNCPADPNPEQADFNADGQGDACEDSDGDGILDDADQCAEQAGDADAAGCPLPDLDGDGVPDRDDQCLTVIGVADNAGCPWPDTDGDTLAGPDDACPNQFGPVENQGCPADSDEDGFIDADDLCPNEPGPLDGCPEIDGDNDGVPDVYDECPLRAGPTATNGCPTDTDGDGLTDSADACPDDPGPIETNGCPQTENNVLDPEVLVPTQFERVTLDPLGIALDYPSSWPDPTVFTDNVLVFYPTAADEALTHPSMVIARGAPDVLLASGTTADVSSPQAAVERTLGQDLGGQHLVADMFNYPAFWVDTRQAEQHLWAWVVELGEADWLHIVALTPISAEDVLFGARALNTMLLSMEVDGRPLLNGLPAVPLVDMPLSRGDAILDRMDDNANGWNPVGAAGGELLLELMPPDTRTGSTSPTSVPITDPAFYAQVTARVRAVPDQYGYGLSFRVSEDGKSYYFLIVDEAQQYRLYSQVNSVTDDLLGPNPSDAIRVGPGATNTLGVLVLGDYIELYVNGQIVGVALTGALDTGNVRVAGFTATEQDAPLIVAFDDFAYVPLPVQGNPVLAEEGRGVLGFVIANQSAIHAAPEVAAEILEPLTADQPVAVLGRSLDSRYVLAYAYGAIGWVDREHVQLIRFGVPVEPTVLPLINSEVSGTRVQVWPVVWPDSVDTDTFESPIGDGESVTWTFSGRAGEVVTLGTEADNPNLDLFMALAGPDGVQLATDDDSGPGLNPLIQGFELPADGEYTVTVQSRRREGAFVLTLTREIVP